MSDRLRMIDGNDPRLFALSNCVSGHAMLLRRALLDRALPLPDVSFHDWWLAFVAANVGRVRYLDEPLVRFRQHRPTLSTFTGDRDRPRVLGAREASRASARLRRTGVVSRSPAAVFPKPGGRLGGASCRAFTPGLVGLLWQPSPFRLR